MYEITRGTRLGFFVVVWLTGIECFIACDFVNSLDFVFEKREVVSTMVTILDEVIGEKCEAFVGGDTMIVDGIGVCLPVGSTTLPNWLSSRKEVDIGK